MLLCSWGRKVVARSAGSVVAEVPLRYNSLVVANTPRPRWPTSTKVVVSVSLLVLAVYLLDRFSAAIAPLILAMILAFILKPLVDLLQGRLRMPRGLAALVVYLALVSILIVVPAALVPRVIEQFRQVNLDLISLAGQVEALISRTVTIAGVDLDLGAASQQASQSLEALMQPVFGQSIVVLLDVITSVVWLIFILVISFYLIKDSQALWRWIEKLPPREYRADFLKLKTEVYEIWRDFLRGQLVLAGVVTVIFSLAGLVLGLPFALALGLLAGLLEFIPSLGHGIWLVVATVLTLIEGSTWLPLPSWIVAVVLIGLHLVFQQVDLNFLIPRIIGRRVHLHPLVVILGIAAGATFAGVLGVVLAAPTIASARVLGRYLRGYLFDREIPVLGGTSESREA